MTILHLKFPLLIQIWPELSPNMQSWNPTVALGIIVHVIFAAHSLSQKWKKKKVLNLT